MKGRDGYDFDGNSIRVELSRGGTMGRGGMGGGGGGGGGGYRYSPERGRACMHACAWAVPLQHTRMQAQHCLQGICKHTQLFVMTGIDSRSQLGCWWLSVER